MLEISNMFLNKIEINISYVVLYITNNMAANNEELSQKYQQKIIKEIENAIDTKVYKWMETKQTKFNNDEKDKIEQFNMELIQFLNSLRDTSKFPTNFREFVETYYIGSRISCVLETLIN